jgi:phosphate transport system substrate-binding protein
MVLAIIFSACSSSKKKDQTISLSGAFALYPMVIKWSEEYKKEHPEARFNISAGGAGKGVADALSGSVDLGMLSRQIEQKEIENGIWWVAVTKDAVIPTINSGNPLLETIKKRGLTRNEFRKIFITGEITNWNQLPGVGTDQVINVFTRSDACGAAATWAEYLGGKQEDLKGTGVFGDPGLAEAVVKDVLGVGFNNTIYLYDIKSGNKNQGIEVIPIDINENGTVDSEEANYDKFDQILAAIASGKYPSPPARDLYLVSKGKPQKQATIDFLKWVITKGQAFVPEAGYVPLNNTTLDEQVSKLN